jgi:hypothetical protein
MEYLLLFLKCQVRFGLAFFSINHDTLAQDLAVLLVSSGRVMTSGKAGGLRKPEPLKEGEKQSAFD